MSNGPICSHLVLKMYFQVRPTHNKGLRREISAGYKQMTDEVWGGREEGIMTLWFADAQWGIWRVHPARAQSILSVNPSKPLTASCLKLGLPHDSLLQRGKTTRRKEQSPHAPCRLMSCHQHEVPLLQTDGALTDSGEHRLHCSYSSL